MLIDLHPHALKRAGERGATKDEIINTVESGEEFPAKFGRTGFRKNFLLNAEWNNKYFITKQVEAYCVKERKYWLVITVIVKYF